MLMLFHNIRGPQFSLIILIFIAIFLAIRHLLKIIFRK